MKTAIVTGASSGIGYYIALKLADLKYSLLITGRNEIKLNELKNLIEVKGVTCKIIIADLSKVDASTHIIKETISQFGQIDVLVNNAGESYSGFISETPCEVWDRIFEINARAPFLLCKEAIPYLKNSANPAIINIGSVVGFKGYAEQGAYAASKHALAGFTKALAKEVQKNGVKVHLISPGGVNTKMAIKMRPDINKDNLILPEEIAELIEFLIKRKGNGTIDHIYLRRKNGLAFD